MENERLTVDEVAAWFQLAPWQRTVLDGLLNDEAAGSYAAAHAAARADRRRYVQALELALQLDETFQPVTVGTFTVPAEDDSARR